MRRLLISDIHANLPALQAVLESAGNCDEIIFLGDLANFGPHPSECVDLIRECGAICIMGNHDHSISFEQQKRGRWEEWSRQQLSDAQLRYMQGFYPNRVVDEGIFALHGAYGVKYDILPNTPLIEVETAFSRDIPEDTKMVLFGHYHYQLDIDFNGKKYHCIRPVGHHRDGDTRASYSILEDGNIKHFRVSYDIEKLIRDIDKIDCLDDSRKLSWKKYLQNAFDARIFSKDLAQMWRNDNNSNQ